METVSQPWGEIQNSSVLNCIPKPTFHFLAECKPKQVQGDHKHGEQHWYHSTSITTYSCPKWLNNDEKETQKHANFF